MKIVAVTACPAGIAHTYMAAESLEREARRRGYQIKVETQGSMGVENAISAKEVQEADVVIFAVDMNISGADRFSGKDIYRAGVAEAIRSPGKILDAAIQLIKKKEARTNAGKESS